ncbi:hypothetical protein WK65_30400 [Burkholderia ubonensis]|uniref:hypothetical protein n=1 Tax=Burkholderia ubonensis TaxID=101571 RepID=UPI00075ED9B3|nr:hypothetical protein [Burkholderia ubonensis]KVU32956.1 hypothetical protein WK65_30400 [Burkholderia ubonensis]
MKNLVLLFRRTLQASAIVAALATLLTGCGGDDNGTAANAAAMHASVSPASNVTQPVVVPADATFAGQTYTEWEIAFWQWAMPLPLDNPPHPFSKCNAWERPISAAQTGNVWFWSAPDLNPDGTPLICDQSAITIPAGKALFLTIRDIEASSLDDPPFRSDTAAGQRSIAQYWFSHIVDVFCKIDGVAVGDVQAFHFLTPQFHFHAPTPWIFGSSGGSGTSVGEGYFLLLQLPPGPHTIHYGGDFHFNAGELGPDPVDFQKDVTLFVTIGPS